MTNGGDGFVGDGFLGDGAVALDLRDLERVRELSIGHESAARALAESLGLSIVDHEVAASFGPVVCSRIEGRGSARHDATLVFVHGGGTVSGNRFTQVSEVLQLVSALDVAGITIEYSLAPEHPYPRAIDEVDVVLEWLFARKGSTSRGSRDVILIGSSAGATIAAGVVLRRAARGVQQVLGQVLTAPMLEVDPERLTSVADSKLTWSTQNHRLAWEMYLGGSDATDPLAVPARAREFDRVPPTYIDCGSDDLFALPAEAFARALTEAGVPTEFHLWPGVSHGFENLDPGSAEAIRAADARMAWVAGILERR